METFREVVVSFFWQGDHLGCSYSVLETWVLLVRDQIGTTWLDELFWAERGLSLYSSVVGWQEPVVVVWHESL